MQADSGPDDMSHLAGDSSSLGADSSIWLRPLRQLLREGKPVGQLVTVIIEGIGEDSLPLGAFSVTKSKRLIFWPVLPKQYELDGPNGNLGVFDHVTLELRTGRTHMTGYGPEDQRLHRGRAWRLERFRGSNVALWCFLAIRSSILREQDRVIERRVSTPATDKERRTAELEKYVANSRINRVPLSPDTKDPDYVYCAAYVVTSKGASLDFPENVALLPPDTSMVAEGWPADCAVKMVRSRVPVAEEEVVLAVACPPGKAKSDVMMGFLRSPPS